MPATGGPSQHVVLLFDFECYLCFRDDGALDSIVPNWIGITCIVQSCTEERNCAGNGLERIFGRVNVLLWGICLLVTLRERMI